DLTRLAQVFSNLLSNSVKYTPAGGKIWLEVESRQQYVDVIVRDTGIGIPPAALPKVFDMFSQVPRNLEHNSGGLGIGLALVKALVEMHDGEVAVSSEWPGNGSIFTVRLPILSAPADAPEAQPVPRRLDAVNRPRRILVVDDNQDSSNSMAMIFELLGHE